MHSTYLFLISTLLNNIPLKSPDEDLVKDLPNYSYEGTLYSGYLEAGKSKKFHYMFNLAEENHEEKPLVLWLNGGPGCSSLDGWSVENGPMFLNTDGTFTMNNYSWNKAANMLYIESPGEVGYSFINSGLDEDIKVDDDIVAKDNLNALLSFFTKFPEYKEKDFYISGESYAGIYIPMLALEIINYNKNLPENNKIKLKGILVGNGVADWENDSSGYTMVDFLFTHHLISYESKLDINRYCLKEESQTKCTETANKIWDVTKNINFYNYLAECEMPTTENGEINYYSNYFMKSSWAFPFLREKQKMMKSFKPKLYSDKQLKEDEKITVPCVNDEPLFKYFNREDVKESLHVNKTKKWDMCSYSVYFRYVMQSKASIWIYPTLFENNIRILIFNGDADVVVSYNGNQNWIEAINLEVLDDWRPWRAFEDNKNVAGYVTKYKGLTFCTVKGAGHEVPRWKPKEGYYMFSQFLKNEDL